MAAESLLYLNDRRGEHAPSWYRDTVEPPARSALLGRNAAEFCIIGGGFTGLAAALRLVQAGRSVIVLDAQRMGWGASGRNGGQLGSGFNRQSALKDQLGEATDLALWQLAEKAKQRVHSLCAEHEIDVQYRSGIFLAERRRRDLPGARRWLQRLHDHYHYTQAEWVSRERVSEFVHSDEYVGGIVDTGAGHLNPLRLALGLAAAAESHGAQLYEHSQVIRIDPRDAGAPHRLRVITPQGHVNCDTVLHCGNGYLQGLNLDTDRRLLPLNNFIVATEPLGDRGRALMPAGVAVADSRFVVFYFRLSDDGRLLFGGGESLRSRFPPDIETLVRGNLERVFPSLADVRIDHAWGGTLAITMNRLPLVRRIAPGQFIAAGYSGHGVALAMLCGEALAGQQLGDGADFELLCSLPTAPFPGGVLMRPLLMQIGMRWFSTLDHLP